MEITQTTPEALRGILTDVVRSVLAEAQPPLPEYLTVAEAARYVKMTPGGIRKWIGSGYLRSYTHGKVTRVLRTDIDALLAGDQTPRR